MKVSLLTDAPNYNLALMKLSAWHKRQGDEVVLNQPVIQAEKTYASILFSWNKNQFIADEYGGIQFPEVYLPRHIERLKPDYELYNLDHSLGYTFRPCYRRCEFCLVKTLKQPDQRHHSIWEFHDKKFDKICLMNNNTFLDPKWKDTFEEIWAVPGLKVMEHGLDVRLIDEEKAEAIKKTKFAGRLHFAWDRMKDEKLIIQGMKFLHQFKITGRFYVLAGYDSTYEQDLHRCQWIVNYNHVPYIMPFNKTKQVKMVKNFINSPANWWHKRDNIKKAFEEYVRGVKTEKPKQEDGQQSLGI